MLSEPEYIKVPPLPIRLRPRSYLCIDGPKDTDMTTEQLRGECQRLRALLEGYDSQAAALGTSNHHIGLRKRLVALEGKLAEAEARS